MAKAPCVTIIDGKEYNKNELMEAIAKGEFEELLATEGVVVSPVVTGTSETETSVTTQPTTEGIVGKTVTFEHAGSPKQGVVKSKDAKGNLEIEGTGVNKGVKYTVKEKDATVVLSGMDKVAQGLQDLAESIGAIKMVDGGEKKDPVKALKVIAEGLIEQGLATAENVWQKINEFLSDKYSPEDLKKLTRYQKEIVDFAKQYDRKSFLETVKDSPQTTEEMKAKVGELEEFYNVLTNEESIANADKIIQKDFDAAKKLVLSDSAISAEKSVIAIRLIKHYEKIGDYDSAVEILDAYDKQLRKAGQFIQAASIWNKTSPQTVVRKASKAAEKAGVELPPEVKASILERMGKLDKMPEGDEKSKATFEVLDYIASQLPLSWTEIFEAYRYQNMLSNPRTHLKNVFGNLENAFAVAPLDMIMEGAYDYFRHPFNASARSVKFSDSIKYLKNVYNTLPMAIQAAADAFRKGYVQQKILDLPSQEASIEALRRTKLPKALTVVPRLLEAEDTFFGVLIGHGEKARLMADGMSEKDATQKGMELAEKYLYREKLGDAEKNKNELHTIRALDSLGHFILRGKEIPYIGRWLGWFVPFVTTPINMAKMGVRRSPIATVDILASKVFGNKNPTKEQVSQATLGSLVFGLAGIAAANGLTEWAQPRDEKEKELFYASGRKPYSVKIGDKWVPMQYFGVFGIPIAMAAALKYHATETKYALTKDDIERVTDAILSITGFLVNQTPLQGVDAMSQTVTNPENQSWGKTLGFTAGQLIPLDGLVKYVNTILDPVFRKSKGFVETIEKDLPVISKEIEPIKDIKGDPAQRQPFNYVLPYDIGLSNDEYNLPIEKRRKRLQENELKRQLKKERGVGSPESQPKKSRGLSPFE